MASQMAKILSKATTESLKTCYFLYGEEDFVMDYCLRRIDSLCGATAGLDRLDVGEAQTSWDQVAEFLAIYPMLSPKKLAVIHNGETFLQKCVADDKQFAEDLQEIPPESVLVVVFRGKPDKRRKVIKNLLAASENENFEFLKPEEKTRWIRTYLERLGKMPEGGVLTILSENTPPNLYGVKAELDKLAAYIGKSRTATLQDVRAVLVPPLAENVFLYLDAILTRNRQEALKIAEDFAAQKLGVMDVLGMLSWQFRILSQVRPYAGRRAPEIAKIIGESPYAVEKSLKLLKNITAAQVEKANALLVKTDYAVKSGGMRDSEGLFYLTAALLSL